MRATVDLKGQRFGSLVVTKQAERIRGIVAWTCLCDCGKVVSKITAQIKIHPHCGCQTSINMSSGIRKVRTKNLASQKFGRLTALHITEDIRRDLVYWLCICDCGKYTSVAAVCLTNKYRPTRSCGCSHQTHGLRYSKENETWRQMKGRCLNPKNLGYRHYGGRGIRVCERWVESFENFYQDLGPAPTKDHTLERVDVNGDYCPENCIWLHKSLQARNKRTNVLTEEKVKLIKTIVDLGCTSTDVLKIFNDLGFTIKYNAINDVVAGRCWADVSKYITADLNYEKIQTIVNKTNFNLTSTKISGKDITGLVSGKLTVLYQTDKKVKGGCYYWLCLCSCGKSIEVQKGYLVKGTSKSCGCTRGESFLIHGYYKHPLYFILKAMIRRCFNPSCKEYSNYGARGITVCNDWMSSIKTFIEWAEVKGYKKGLQIGRIDNNESYTPDNCRFVTRKENILNRRITMYLLLNGEKTLAVDVAAKLHVSRRTVYDWIKYKEVTPRFRNIVALVKGDNCV